MVLLTTMLYSPYELFGYTCSGDSVGSPSSTDPTTPPPQTPPSPDTPYVNPGGTTGGGNPPPPEFVRLAILVHTLTVPVLPARVRTGAVNVLPAIPALCRIVLDRAGADAPMVLPAPIVAGPRLAPSVFPVQVVCPTLSPPA